MFGSSIETKQMWVVSTHERRRREKNEEKKTVVDYVRSTHNAFTLSTRSWCFRWDQFTTRANTHNQNVDQQIVSCDDIFIFCVPTSRRRNAPTNIGLVAQLRWIGAHNLCIQFLSSVFTWVIFFSSWKRRRKNMEPKMPGKAINSFSVAAQCSSRMGHAPRNRKRIELQKCATQLKSTPNDTFN